MTIFQHNDLSGLKKKKKKKKNLRNNNFFEQWLFGVFIFGIRTFRNKSRSEQWLFGIYTCTKISLVVCQSFLCCVDNYNELCM